MTRVLRHYYRILMLAAGLAVFTPTLAYADAAAPLSDAAKAEIEKLVHDYITENPQVILEAVHKYQADQEAQQEAQRNQRIAALRNEIERAPSSPVGGNPDGDVTIAQFFDYRCGYCKQVHSALMESVKADGNVRLVYKEFPILGPDSLIASRAALGVFYNDPAKYLAFSNDLMESRGQLPEARVIEIAAKSGIDAKALKKFMDDPRVRDELNATRALAQSLEISGTPAFVIAGTLVPGAVNKDTLVELIAKARKG